MVYLILSDAENICKIRHSNNTTSRMDNQNTNKTHCIRGHEFDAVNTYVTPNGVRRCKACTSARGIAKRANARGPKLTLEERFWPNVDKAPGLGRDGDCWEWRGNIRKDGYGQARDEYVGTRRTHRIAFALINGPITSEQMLLHSCDNRACCNPDHLRIGTQYENIQDMISRGRHVGNGYELRTHCIRGHEFTPENTYTSQVGKRQCCTCVLAKSKVRNLIKAQNRKQLFFINQTPQPQQYV